jgi:hypothetical protein
MYSDEEAERITTLICKYHTLEYISKKFIEKKKLIPSGILSDMKKCKNEVGNEKLFTDILNIVRKTEKKLDTEGKSIMKDIYKAYSHEQKYIGETEIKDVMCISINQDGKVSDVGKDIVPSFRNFMREKKKAVCFTYHHYQEELNWLDPNEYTEQMKQYRKNFKEGKIIVREQNNTEQKINDVSWYSLVIQDVNGYIGSCSGSLKLFGFLVDGFVYWYPNKQNRDNMYKWLTNEK